jgi:uncharacterized protein with gpF-like domain
MSNLTRALAVLLVDHGVRLIQTADSLTQEQNDRIRELIDTIVALLLSTDLTDRLDYSAMIVAVRTAVTAAYERMAAASSASVEDLAQTEVRALATLTNQAAKAPLVRVPQLKINEPTIGGSLLSHWWDAQENDTSFKVVAAIRAGVSAGMDAEQIAHTVANAAGPFAGALRNAESLTHTMVQRVAMDARTAVIGANSTTVGLEIVATLDSRTCAQCLAYDGSTYDLDYNPTGDTALPYGQGPQYHFHCRCMVVPIFRDLPGVEGANGKPSGKLSAEQWLDGKTETQQDDILGKGRAALYRKGSLTLRDLVSGTGQQLSLADLRKKYN